MASNPFYQPNSSYGSPLGSLFDSPFVRDFLSAETPGAEVEAYLTRQGFGGFGRKDQFARGLVPRINTGFKTATLNNPFLTERDYLNQHLGSGFVDTIWNDATPEMRGEGGVARTLGGRARLIGRG
jgi:hypothetical protein